jgi:F-type H+-transporting ATPase subunit gamma
MTERLADIRARIDGVRQLDAVVNAMRGIAAARVRQARAQLDAAGCHADTVAKAIGRAFGIAPAPEEDPVGRPAGVALVLFCAEQGFAGAFSERMLEAARTDLGSGAVLFLLGTRGAATAADRGVVAHWDGAMPSHPSGIPMLADRIAEALCHRIAAGAVDRVEVLFSHGAAGHGVPVERRRLFPLDPSIGGDVGGARPPVVTHLAAPALRAALVGEHLHAQLCHVALHSFAAENGARMAAMTAAHAQVGRTLASMQAAQRLIRQDEITAEIVELAAGEPGGATPSRTRETHPG